jgi:hypothetical protein
MFGPIPLRNGHRTDLRSVGSGDSFFKSKDVRPNVMLAASQVNQQFLANGGKLADYAAAFSTQQNEVGSNSLQTTDSD